MDIARELKKSNKQCPPDTKEKRNVQPIRDGWVVYLEVRPERLELPTFCSEDKRSVQLSYGRSEVVIIVDLIKVLESYPGQYGSY